MPGVAKLPAQPQQVDITLEEARQAAIKRCGHALWGKPVSAEIMAAILTDIWHARSLAELDAIEDEAAWR
jgi:hypothetical protein